MKITVNWYSHEVDRIVIETMIVNPQSENELTSILNDCRVAKISDETADNLVKNGALDLRQ